MKNRSSKKHRLRIAFSIILATAIISLTLLTLAENRGIGTSSLSPSQILELTGNEKKDADFSSKIGKEISELFDKGSN